MDSVSHHSLSQTGASTYEVLFEDRCPGPAPKVTVIVSLFNYERYIVDCLESVLLQSLGDLDLLVADDCSRDSSAEICLDWMGMHSQRFRRCLLVRNTVNRQLAATRNLLFGLARTEYVFVLDADNMIYPRCLQALASALDHCDAAFSYCYLQKYGIECGLTSWEAWDPQALMNGNYIDAMSLVRRNAWQQVGGYASDMPAMGWEDFDFWLKIARTGGWGILVPEVLAKYRVHLNSMLRTETNRRESAIWEYMERKHPGIRRAEQSYEDRCLENDEITLHCDRVRYVEDSPDGAHLEVWGWAVSRFSISRIEVLLDQQSAGTVRYGDYRPELGARVKGYPNGIRCGLSLNERIEPLDPGMHTVTVRATSTSGKQIQVHTTMEVARRSALQALADDHAREWHSSYP
jgi:glycosyltransferase involved in cell wall biosynthesis